MREGAKLGLKEGACEVDGCVDGLALARLVGILLKLGGIEAETDGVTVLVGEYVLVVGVTVVCLLGDVVGKTVGDVDGAFVGDDDGSFVGDDDGSLLG